MSNVPTTTQSKDLTTSMAPKSIATSVEASDIQIPKILLMQGLSDLVAEQRASMGDFVDSLTGDKLGSSKEPVLVIPICMWKDFLITEKRGNKFEFKEIKPYTVETAHWRDFEHREFTENGTPHQRNLRMNYAVLLAKDASDLGAFPYVISFQRTGLKAGKAFANFFLKASTKGQKPWFFTLGLGAKLDKNDQGTFYVPTVASAVQTQDLETVNELCQQWETIFAQGNAKIAESEAANTMEAGNAPQSTEAETRF